MSSKQSSSFQSCKKMSYNSLTDRASLRTTYKHGRWKSASHFRRRAHIRKTLNGKSLWCLDGHFSGHYHRDEEGGLRPTGSGWLKRTVAWAQRGSGHCSAGAWRGGGGHLVINSSLWRALAGLPSNNYVRGSATLIA